MAKRKGPRKLLAFWIIPALVHASCAATLSCLCVACGAGVLYGICDPSEVTLPFSKIHFFGYSISLSLFFFSGSGVGREGQL